MIHAEGPLLSIDVTEQRTMEESIDEVLHRFIGGRGVGTKIAHDRIPFSASAFGPENRVVFATGPMQMSNMSFTGRMNATALSPLTDGLVSSNAGGFMSRNFAATGYSAVSISGKSEKHIIIHVRDDGVEFEEVPELEEATVPETLNHIENISELGAEHVASVGPAGDNLVRYAAIISSRSRAFGRGGLGAVLGSKRVKAITFNGDSAPDIEIPDVGSQIHSDAAKSDSIMKRQGTPAIMDMANEIGSLPTRYFSDTSYENAEKINGEVVESKKYKRGTCSACAFGCKLPTKDEAENLETEGPEFETLMAFGSNADVDDITSIMKSNELCDIYGLDTISTGDVISAYLAAHNEFGNKDLVHELVERIAYREGVGDLLAKGIERFHDEVGVENWTVKGMEFPAHDGRTLHGQGLSFAVSNNGADHNYGSLLSYEYPIVQSELAIEREGLEGKPSLLVERENTRAVEDSAVFCKFSRDFIATQPEIFEMILDTNMKEIKSVGASIIDLERHFNNKRGMTRSDDKLPYDLPEFETALDDYYELRNWTEDGTVPDGRI